MKKQDFLAPFIIGEASALIFLGISRSLELPPIVFRFAKFFPIILPLLSILGIYISQVLFKKIPAIFQAAKSFLVGILNTFIDLGVLNLLMGISGITSGWLYSVFVSFSFACSTVNSYFWNKFWAFSSSAEGFGGQGEKRVTGKEFLQFCLVAGGGLLIHIIISSFVVNIIGVQFGLTEQIWANIGKIIAVFFGFLWNFLGYKFIVFKK